MALKRVNFATAHNASTFTSARWNFQPVPDGFGNAPIQLVEIAPGNPRFAYDPATGEPEGLLIEEQRTNEIAHSFDFANAAWSKVGVGTGNIPIVTPEFSESPFQGIMATRVQCKLNGGTTISDRSWLEYAADPSDATNRTAYFWVKSNTGATQNVVIGQNNAALRQVTPEWSMIFLTRENSTAAIPRIGLVGSQAGRDEEIDILICHAQSEIGQPSSPIITNGTAVTRTADIVARTLGAEWNPNEGTFVVDVYEETNQNRSTYFGTNSTALGLSFGIYRVSNNIFMSIGEAGAGAASAKVTSPLGRKIIAGTFNKTTKRVAISVNGGPVANPESVIDDADLATPTELRIQNGAPSSNNPSSGFTTTQVLYEPRAVSDARLQELSKL